MHVMEEWWQWTDDDENTLTRRKFFSKCKEFRNAYIKLGEEGYCDSFGGAESERVWFSLLEQGIDNCDDLEQFIIREANM